VSTQYFHACWHVHLIHIFHAHLAWLKISSKPRVKECSSHFLSAGVCIGFQGSLKRESYLTPPTELVKICKSCNNWIWIWCGKPGSHKHHENNVNARSHTPHPADSTLFQPSKAGSGLIARKPLWLRASWASPLHTGITHPMAQPDSWNQNRHGITSSMPWDKTSWCRRPTCCLIFSRSHATLSSGRGKWFFAQWSWNAWHRAKAKGQALLNSEPWSPFSSKQESLL